MDTDGAPLQLRLLWASIGKQMFSDSVTTAVDPEPTLSQRTCAACLASIPDDNAELKGRRCLAVIFERLVISF
jgi:hypothetical protein